MLPGFTDIRQQQTVALHTPMINLPGIDGRFFGVLLLQRRLGKGLVEVGGEEERIIAEAAGAAVFAQNIALALAAGDDRLLTL